MKGKLRVHGKQDGPCSALIHSLIHTQERYSTVGSGLLYVSRPQSTTSCPPVRACGTVDAPETLCYGLGTAPIRAHCTDSFDRMFDARLGASACFRVIGHRVVASRHTAQRGGSQNCAVNTLPLPQNPTGVAPGSGRRLTLPLALTVAIGKMVYTQKSLALPLGCIDLGASEGRFIKQHVFRHQHREACRSQRSSQRIKGGYTCPRFAHTR
jgi:hypothetical protein